ncbi:MULTISPECIES: hypothetical protein [Luteibacter]|uniref:hypothetical protein n=1 Tax=Luteibacter TaxID=242605 RepID=UPI000567F82D|nr:MULTISPECIES: hypothetical protein [unclassified Luteibacter]
MHLATPRLFTRLRRHRGVWVLALAVLLFKLTMATFCLLDGPTAASVDTAGATIAVATSDTAAGDTCVLNEGGGCHCSCAHNVAVPSTMPALLAGVPHVHVTATLRTGVTPTYERSPLRPPIA